MADRHSRWQPREVLDGVSERAFAVLERGIYYVERQGGGRGGPVTVGISGHPGTDVRGRLRFFDFAHAKSTIVADLGDRVTLGLGVSPDGRTILFTRMDNPSSDLMMIENFR